MTFRIRRKSIEARRSLPLSCRLQVHSRQENDHNSTEKDQVMKRNRFNKFMLLAAVVAALSLSVAASAGEQVPFKGQSSGLITPVGFDPVKGILSVHEVGEERQLISGVSHRSGSHRSMSIRPQEW